MVRRVKQVVLVLAAAILCLPLVQWLFAPFPVEPVTETRARLAMPAGNPLTQPWYDRSFARRFEKAFNDNFAFRDFYIRLANQIDYSLFRTSDQVLIAHGDWLFDKPAILVQQRAVDLMPDVDQDRVVARIQRMRDWLARRGIQLVLVPVPWKNTVYRQLDADLGIVRPEPTGYARLVARLRAAGLDTVDVMGDLKRAIADGHQAYFHGDPHWTLPAAHYVSNDVIDHVRRLAGRAGPPVDEHPPLQIAHTFIGSEASTLGVFFPPVDVFKDVYHYDSCMTRRERRLASGQTTLEWLNRTPSPNLLPPTMLIGNSFLGYFLECEFHRYFSVIYQQHDLSQFGAFDRLVQDDTRFVVWQFFELEIVYQFQDFGWWHWLDTAP